MARRLRRDGHGHVLERNTETMMLKKTTGMAMVAAAALLAGQASAGTLSTTGEVNGADPLSGSHSLGSEASSYAVVPDETYAELTPALGVRDSLPDHLTVFNPDGSVYHYQFVPVDLLLPQDGYHATAEFGDATVLGPDGAHFMVVEVADPLIVFVDESGVHLGSIVWIEAEDSGDTIQVADAGDMRLANNETAAQEDEFVIG
jgi:hypothetical protein